jgi:hypothetical protein
MLSKIAQTQQITVIPQALLHTRQVFIRQAILMNVVPQAQESDTEQNAFLQASQQVAFAHQLQHQHQHQHQRLVAL